MSGSNTTETFPQGSGELPLHIKEMTYVLTTAVLEFGFLLLMGTLIRNDNTKPLYKRYVEIVTVSCVFYAIIAAAVVIVMEKRGWIIFARSLRYSAYISLLAALVVLIVGLID